MSWDFGMVADLGNGEVQVGGTHNYTSNVRKMFVLALDNKEGIRCCFYFVSRTSPVCECCFLDRYLTFLYQFHVRIL